LANIFTRFFASKTSIPLESPPASWRASLRLQEVTEGSAEAAALFQKSFGHPLPDMPRHFLLLYQSTDAAPVLAAYIHHLQFENVYLCGGMCVDAGVYRQMPKQLYQQIKNEGGLATIIARESFSRLGDSVAVFGHVGEPRARQADLRAGFVDTDRPHLMVVWRKSLPPDEQKILIDKVEALGPF
jgi:hypothetical protein